MKLGIDVSTYLEELSHGAKYYDGNRKVDPLDLLRVNGVEYMRIRLWVDPYDENGEPYLAGTCDIKNFIELSKLAQIKGYRIMLDIHYSDFWCDPAKQCIPKSWEHNDINKLSQTVYEYTLETLKTAAENGITIDYIQVGNEITNGMLWPLGKLEYTDSVPRSNYDGLKMLLNSGIKACRESLPNARLVLHLERSYDTELYDEFFGQMRDVDYDAIGFSYYPYWHGTFEQFFANVENCKKFGKELIVAELGYGFTLEDYIKNAHGGAHLVINAAVADEMGFCKDYPLTPEGQARFVKEFLKRAEAHGVSTVYWWEPLWIPGDGICWASDAAQRYQGATEIKSSRNEWANQCLFDYEGKKLPAFNEFRIVK